jgi:PIN domain nuclease of toxin-antitoxin system
MVTSFLLDTHSLIWWWTNDIKKLGRRAANILESDDSLLFVSAASVWEIAIKTRSGKLTVVEDFQRDYAPLMYLNRFETLPMTDEHALRAGFLPGKHGDPFDRMIAAQALVEGMTVLTRDREIAAFGCNVIW